MLSLSASSTPAQEATFPTDVCSDRLASLFAPIDPDAPGAYRVCRSAQAFEVLKPAGWPVEPMSAADAFAGAPPAVRRTLTLLYGGQAVRVSRGWRRRPPHIEAVTLIAPAPDDELLRLTAGTLVVLQERKETQASQARTP